MRFLAAWMTSLVAVALVSALVLGRDAPAQTAADFDERYATALADIEAGGVLYLRSQQLLAPAAAGATTAIRGHETWVTMDGSVPVARSEESNDQGEVVRILEFEGATQTLLVDRLAGIENREPVAVVPVQSPTQLLTELHARMRDLALRADPPIDDSTVAASAASQLAGPDPATSDTATRASVIEELTLVQWAVLPAGTPLGTRPD